MSSFRKERTCPSSFEIVDAACGSIDGLRGLEIASHLGRCDFCAAEMALYQAFPPESSEIRTPEIPQPLFELAEALLAHETIHISRLRSLLGEAA
jgi:hypothetical protein